MKIKEYNDMKAWLVKPGTPEQAKKAEENNKKYLEERAAKTRKYFGLDKPLIVNNGSIQTEEQFKKELPIEDQPGYDVSKDPNLYRRIKLYSDQDFGPEFDKAIADEDAALKKLGRDPKNILQRGKVVKPVKAPIKKTKPIQPMKADPIISDPYSGIEPKLDEPIDPKLKILEEKYKAAQEQKYQEKVKNNSMGLRSFAPIMVKRND
jgi:hypothetical protein